MTAADVIRIKELLPTSLGSEEIREQIAREILQRSIFSARMESARYLAKVRDVCSQIAAGEINQADARLKLVTLLEQMGHSPQDGGGITNPASIRRLNLVVDTQRQMAASVAVLSEQTEATVTPLIICHKPNKKDAITTPSHLCFSKKLIKVSCKYTRNTNSSTGPIINI